MTDIKQQAAPPMQSPEWYARREKHARDMGYTGLADALLALEALRERRPADSDLPGMWERADLVGGETDAAEKSVDVDAISRQIAREIFALGDEQGSPCTRLQFMGGKWPDCERRQGGIGEAPLVGIIAKMLERAIGGGA